MHFEARICAFVSEQATDSIGTVMRLSRRFDAESTIYVRYALYVFTPNYTIGADHVLDPKAHSSGRRFP